MAIKAKEELTQIKLGAKEVHKSKWKSGDLATYYSALGKIHEMGIS